MRIFAIVAALFPLLASSPALAADKATIGCIQTALGQEAFGRIVEKSAADFESDLNTVMGSDYDLYVAALRGCQERNHWSDAAMRLASSYTRTHIVIAAAELRLRRQGFDPAKIESRYTAMPVAQREQMSKGEVPTEIYAVVTALQDEQHVPDSRAESNASDLAEILMGMALLEFCPARFEAA